MSKLEMRGLLVGLILLCGCGPGLRYHEEPKNSPKQWAQQADIGFIGVLRKQQFDSLPLWKPNLPGSARDWKVLRREVEVDIPLKGEVRRGAVVDVYEYYWTGGLSGNYNSTQVGGRGLYWVRLEGGKLHLILDMFRSIYRIGGGRHDRLPGGSEMPLWERIALASWWFESNSDEGWAWLGFNESDSQLSQWRRLKLTRGLLRHPKTAVRWAACQSLVWLWSEQDECWATLPSKEQQDLLSNHPELARKLREPMRPMDQTWAYAETQDERRLLTTVRDEERRRQFCELYLRTYPGDRDHGCPAYGPRPATRVTASGDEALAGPWPRDER